MGIAAGIVLGFHEFDSISILHGENGPFIPEVEEWCNRVISLNY